MANLQVGPKTLALLRDPNFEEWDDEDLIRGQQKDKRGRYNGKLPKVVPLGLLQELHKRNASKAIHKLEQTLIPAVKYLCDVAEGKAEPDPDRIRVCETLLNRILGKQADRVVVTSDTEESRYKKAGVTKAVVLRDLTDEDDSHVIEASVVEQDDDDYDPFA